MQNKKLRLFSELTSGQFDRISKADPLAKLLLYFSNLDALERIEIIRNRFAIFKSLAKEAKDLTGNSQIDLSVVELASLALAINEHKAPSKTFYKKMRRNAPLSDPEAAYAENLSVQRRSSKPKQAWLQLHSATIQNLRENHKLSWRKIEEFLKSKRNQNISHTTIKEWYYDKNKKK